MKAKTKQQEYNLIMSLQLTNDYLEYALRSDQLPISLEKKEKVIFKIIMDCYSREKNIVNIIVEVQISQRSVIYILKKERYKKVKLFWKLKLSLVIKTIHLAFAIKYRN